MTAEVERKRPLAYSARGAAEELSLPYETFLALLHDGKIAYIKDRRRYVIPTTALDDYLARASRQPG